MDGKKRISRLRNAEKWKRVGLEGIAQFFGKAEVKSAMKAKIIDDFTPGALPVGKLRPKKAKKHPPEGMIWDAWGYTWIKPPVPGVFGSAHLMIEALKKKGFKQLGAGHYSTVLAKDGHDKVIKVTRHQDNWIDYVKWGAEKGYAGGFAPRVYSWKKFPGDWSWAVMERMDRCLGYSGHYNSSGEQTSNGHTDDLDLIFALLPPACGGKIMAQVYMEDLVPGALDFVKKLKSEMRASDIRGANTMVRKDGSLCFTDPCAGETKITKTRLRSGDLSPSIWRYYANY